MLVFEQLVVAVPVVLCGAEPYFFHYLPPYGATFHLKFV